MRNVIVYLLATTACMHIIMHGTNLQSSHVPCVIRNLIDMLVELCIITDCMCEN